MKQLKISKKGTLGATLLGNLLTGMGTIRSVEGAIKAGEGKIRAGRIFNAALSIT